MKNFIFIKLCANFDKKKYLRPLRMSPSYDFESIYETMQTFIFIKFCTGFDKNNEPFLAKLGPITERSQSTNEGP